MKRRDVLVNLSVLSDQFGPVEYLARARVLGVEKKTGKLWVKGWGFRTQAAPLHAVIEL